MNYQKLIRYIPYIISFILLTILLVTCKENKEKTKQLSDLQTVKEFNKQLSQKLDSVQNKLGQVVKSQKVVEANNQATMKDLFNEIFQLKDRDSKRVKEVETLIRAVQKVGINNIYIPYKPDSTEKDRFNGDSLVPRDSVIIPPKVFRDSTENYDIAGTVNLKNVQLSSISLIDTSSFGVVKESKKGLLKRWFSPNQTTIKSLHSNPYVTDVGIQAMTVKHEPNAWSKWLKPLLVGIASSYLTYKLLKK